MSVDPPLGSCPPWCEQPAGQLWDDVWTNAPVRMHSWTPTITRYQTIRVDELEQKTRVGPQRRGEGVLDVEARVRRDFTTAENAPTLLTQTVTVARTNLPVGQRK